MDKFFEKTLSSNKIYDGKIFEILSDKVELSDGLVRPREVVVHPGGVVVVAQKDESVLMVKQYRYPIHSNCWKKQDIMQRIGVRWVLSIRAPEFAQRNCIFTKQMSYILKDRCLMREKL